MSEPNLLFQAGYLLAVSNLVNMHGADTEAADVLAELGVTESILKKLDLSDYDAKPLRRLFRDISRRRKLARAKTRKAPSNVS